MEESNMTTRDIMNIIMRRDDLRYLKQIMNILDEREKLVIEKRFGFNGELKTLDELSSQLHCSRERIRQIQTRALQTLKKEFRKIDPDSIERQEKEREIEKEIYKKQTAITHKRIELKVRQEIREKMRQAKRPLAPRRTRNTSDDTESEHYKFISSFDFSEYDVKRFKRLELSRESISERIRTVVAELHPELIIHEIKQWKIIGKYLVTNYQPIDGAAYRRIDIYLPYFLASKEDRERFVNELRPFCHLLQDATIEEILRFLKLND